MTTEFAESYEAGLPLEIDAPREGCIVVSAGGEIDAHTAPRLRECIHGVLAAADVDHLVIDLTGATFLDSSALGVLIGALKRMGEVEGRLDIVLPTSPLRRIFEITALDRILTLHETRAAALGSASV